MKLVSVIIITKNQSRFLKKCINSIVVQSYKNIEVIIVDDNSSDNTKEIIESNKSNKIRYFLNEKKLGLAGLRNFGVFDILF